MRQKKKKTKSMRNVINELERINAKTGQFMKGLTEIEGKNLFNDLNYGDMVIVYKNPF